MTTAQPAAKKPFWKKLWFWIMVGVVLLIGIIGNLVSGGDSTEAAPTPTPASTTATTPIPDVVGMRGDEAHDLLKDSGFAVKLDGGEKSVWMKYNWDVVRTDPVVGTAIPEGELVTVHVVEATERLAQEKADRDQAQADSDAEYAAAPVDVGTAQALCDARAELEFPYGAKLHWVLGELATTQTEAGWFLKVEATVTNMFGAKQKNVNVECHVSGTNGSPQMDDFLAY